MRNFYIFILIFTLLLTAAVPGSAESEDSASIKRLAGLAKLWGLVKFCHPYLAYKKIDWDNALIKSLLTVRTAGSKEQYRQALEQLLSLLDDPATRIEATPEEKISEEKNLLVKDKPEKTQRPQPYVDKHENGIAVLVATDYSQFSEVSTTWVKMFTDFQKAFAEAGGSKKVLIDLRNLKGNPSFLINMTVPRFIPWILGEDVLLPPLRFFSHKGYPSQREATFAYNSNFTIRSSGVIRAQRWISSVPDEIVFLINRRGADFSTILTALQGKNLAVVVHEGEVPAGAGVQTMPLDLPEGLKAHIRCTEMLRGDGGTGFRPDLIVEKDALQAGLDILRGSRPRPKADSPKTLNSPAIQNFTVVEKTYPDMTYPNREYRLLGLFRFWNIINYFFPYTDLMDHSWEDILLEFIPKMDKAKDAAGYVLTVAELAAKIQDSHGTISSPILTKYLGVYSPSAGVEYIEGETVVTQIADPALNEKGLEIGDIVTQIDGIDVLEQRNRLARVTPASTPGRLQGLIHSRLLAGENESTLSLRVKKKSRGR